MDLTNTNSEYKKLEIEDSFFEEEERCGYVVSAKMKRVWAVELDLLYQLDQVCKKYGIQYYGSAGTILGAERHKGMIPWDDDIDLMMMRDQYDLLCAHADEFKEPYFLQTFDTDEGYFRGHAQLRNSNTTGVLVEEIEKNVTFNQGIFIDIFPLDNVVRNRKLWKKQMERIDKYREQAKKLYRTTVGFDPENASRLRKTAHLFMPLVSKVYSWKDAYRKFEEECRRYNHLPTKYVAKISYQPYGMKMYDLRSEFDDTVYLDFEMLKLPVPKGYKLHLKRQFGDYHKFVIGSSDHGKLVLDPDIPYKEWIRMYREDPEGTMQRNFLAE
ncbi:MAG: LicD family protein [Lachnospiraceae bacterium]|nr:LicD family protein [Lachnospiraceae bacterium]